MTDTACLNIPIPGCIFAQIKYTVLNFEDDISACLDVLRAGGLILYPTDTIWGIGCDATDPQAVGKIYALKKRSETRSMIVLLAGEKDLMKYVSHLDLQVFDFLKTRSRPTTVVYEGAIGLAGNLVSSDGTIGIRLVNDIFCKHLVKRFRKPIVSTSANISGETTPENFDSITDVIKNGVNYIAHHRRSEIASASPSSIVRWNRDATVTIIRE